MAQSAARGRLLSSLIGLVVLSALLAAVYDDSSRRDRAGLRAVAGCADVLLVLVPGNSEGAGTTPVSPGRTMARFAATYVKQAGATGRTVETRTIQFRTPSLAALRPANTSLPVNRSITATRARQWAGSSDWAWQNALALLSDRAQACPAQSIVLGGYAQGAGALHRLLRRLGTTALSQRVIGAALVSDPQRIRDTKALRWGRVAAPGTAIGLLQATRVHVTGDAPVPGSYPRVISVCRDNDAVCDYGGQSAATGLAIAATYYRDNVDQLDRAAADLAVRTRGVPDPRPAVTEASGQAGTSLSRQLAADVLPHYAGALRWAPTSALPAGMALSPTGLLSGTPAAAGTFTIDYTVQNTAVPAFSRPIPGRVVLKVSPKPTTPVAPATPGRSSAGGDTSCGIKPDNSLWCWGDNYEGQVGVNSRDNKTSPQRVGGTITFLSVNTGSTHTCAISTTNALYCWGRNDYGQVGDGSRTRRLTPVHIGPNRYRAVATNTHHTCAIATDTSLWCWGMNDKGQLGTGDRTIRITPTRIGTSTGWTTVSTGAWHSCATRSDGAALCWGANFFGQLGRGDTVERLAPTRIAGPGDGYGYRMISAGDTHSCAVTTGARARCWGANTSGQLGDGTAGLRTLPVDVADSTSYSSVDAGLMTSCGVTTTQRVRCWGAGFTGLLGAGEVRTAIRPVTSSTLETFHRVEVGWGHTCAGATSGATWCWGLSSAGQIGKGNHETVRTPVQVVP